MLVRNTVSGVVVDIPAEKALGHGWFGQFYVPAEKNKNEVLAPAYKVVDGERVKIEDDEIEVDSVDDEIDLKDVKDVKK